MEGTKMEVTKIEEPEKKYIKQYVDLLLKQKEFKDFFNKKREEIRTEYSKQGVNVALVERGIREVKSELKEKKRKENKKCRDCRCLLNQENCSKSQLGLNNSRCKECVKVRNKKRGK